MTGAAHVAWEFCSVFNHPETTSLIRGTYTEHPYWRRVLQYCRDGNLQAVLDEWTHMIDDFGLEDAAPATVIDTITDDMRDALSLRTASAKMDDITVNDTDISLTQRRIRCHFAMQFGRADDFDADERIRRDDVRDAFNSPFWPFVLATTSVGQEGLDFHPYCHAVMHWNLSSNPVDLEQREGRVHRYKGHAVRKNAATTHSHHALQDGTGDPWTTLFSHAATAADTDSDLAPYWVYTGDDSDAAAGIERHAPMLPVSNEQHKYADLKESLAVYRMAFGQPRQEDLVEYLLQHLDRDELTERLTTLQIDLSPP